MGIYPDSKLLMAYSRWHIKKCNGKCAMSDADMTLVGLPDVYRLWYEVREVDGKAQPVAVIDIKGGGLDKEPTKTAKAVYDWLIGHDMPVYIVQTTIAFKHFIVTKYSNGARRNMNEQEYIAWIESLKISP